MSDNHNESDEQRWISGKEALRHCNWRESHGVELPFRQWLASIGVPCIKQTGKKWLIDKQLLDSKLTQLQAMQREGLDDRDIYYHIGGFELNE